MMKIIGFINSLKTREAVSTTIVKTATGVYRNLSLKIYNVLVALNIFKILLTTMMFTSLEGLKVEY